MSATRTWLVLHLAGAAQPVQVALDAARAAELQNQLAELMTRGEVVSLETANSDQFVVNFTHVATAHIATGRIEANAYGEPFRGAGFGT
jgi:hypothetical protein